MAQMIVRNLEDSVKRRLQARARRHGRSTEEEVREILRNAVRGEGAQPGALGSRIAARFAGDGVELDLTGLAGQPPRPAEFDPDL
jgi:plasmid stability protein